MVVQLRVGVRELAVLAGLVLVVLLAWAVGPARSADAGPPAVDSYAFVARADNPVDALAAGAVAGQLGAPVFLTASGGLDEFAAKGLKAAAPDVVVLAGGLNALTPALAAQVASLLPDATVRRIGGGTRTETAQLVNLLTTELGVSRPVVAGGTVVGDVGIDGALTVDGTDVGAALAAMDARLDDLAAELTATRGELATTRADLTAATGRVAALESTLAGVTRTDDVLLFSGMNVQVVNGEGATNTLNGLGNLIVGYNAASAFFPTPRTGSHTMVIGDGHDWSSWGGLIAGQGNRVTGPNATASGGRDNQVSGSAASISGGTSGRATGSSSAISGGINNQANGVAAAVSGGIYNNASANWTSVVGGRYGTVSDDYDSRIGNTAFPDS